jgi:hypothetical protein
MRAICFFLGTILTACSHGINYTYSKKNFMAPTFRTDLSECRHKNPFVRAHQATPPDQRPSMDDATVRDCMKAKGYKVETEARQL